MTLDEYQEKAHQTSKDTHIGDDPTVWSAHKSGFEN